MIKVTYLPVFVTRLFHGMPGVWKAQHRLSLIWLIVMQALFPGRKTVTALARWTPADITEWRFRRLLKATYWDVHRLIAWWAHQVISVLPPPQDGVLTLTGDGSHKPKRGKHNPVAQKGRKSQHDPWFFGVRFALLIVVVHVNRAANLDWLNMQYDQSLNHLSGGPDHAIRCDSCSHRRRRSHSPGRFVALALPPWQAHTRSHQVAQSHTRSQAVCRLHPQARVPRL